MPKTPHAPMPPVTAATLKEAFVKTVQNVVKLEAIGRRPETKSTCAELVLFPAEIGNIMEYPNGEELRNLRHRARSLRNLRYETAARKQRRNGAPALVTAAASATGDAPAMGAIRTCNATTKSMIQTGKIKYSKPQLYPQQVDKRNQTRQHDMSGTHCLTLTFGDGGVMPTFSSGFEYFVHLRYVLLMSCMLDSAIFCLFAKSP